MLRRRLIEQRCSRLKKPLKDGKIGSESSEESSEGSSSRDIQVNRGDWRGVGVTSL